MTYLNLVNNVLRRLREDEVSNVSESTYSKMVGDFVNDAKKLVENAWDWSALRSTLTITTAADDYTYSLAGSGNQGRVFRIINDTSNCELQYQTQAWFDNEFFVNNPVSGADADTLAIPAQPVIHMAVALLSRERGETGGTSTAEYFALADKYLSDAIDLDAQKHPEETIFYTP
jgi:hypothetical protein